MKTLKKDGINEKLLIETVAYVFSHEQAYDQGTYRTVEVHNHRCKTTMCIAGHAAITLGGAKDVVKRPIVSAFLAVRELRATDKQLSQVENWNSTYGSVQALPEEINAGVSMVYNVNNRDVHVVGIEERAKLLLGFKAVDGPSYDLFSGSMTPQTIVEHLAEVLERTEESVMTSVRRVARKNNWRIPADILEDKDE